MKLEIDGISTALLRPAHLLSKGCFHPRLLGGDLLAQLVGQQRVNERASQIARLVFERAGCQGVPEPASAGDLPRTSARFTSKCGTGGVPSLR